MTLDRPTRTTRTKRTSHRTRIGIALALSLTVLPLAACGLGEDDSVSLLADSEI